MRVRFHGRQPATVLARTRSPQLATMLSGTTLSRQAGFMFAGLANDAANRLPESAETVAALKRLGASMVQDSGPGLGSIPSGYTYFGQFIDHDVSDTRISMAPDLNAATITPLTAAEALSRVTNAKSPLFDLDSVYEGDATLATADDGSMLLGRVTTAGVTGVIPTADPFHDLHRLPMTTKPLAAQTLEERRDDRRALIGDRRNDENLVTAQLHVAFLRAHNALMRGRNMTAEAAKTALLRRYQWAILHDFMPRICMPSVAAEVLANGARWAVASADQLFIPLEFSSAAYRFGHSMVRGTYVFNASHPFAGLSDLMTFTAMSGNFNQADHPETQKPSLPGDWVIDWRRFVPGAAIDEPRLNRARRLDTFMAADLGRLRDESGFVHRDMLAHLAARNLLRGYMLGLPTGQAVAQSLGVPVVSRNVLRLALTLNMRDAFARAGFFDRTPLWFYILAEAGDPAGANGQSLGPVGSRIVADTLWTIAKFSPHSVVASPPTAAELATGEFSLPGIIEIGREMPGLVA